MSAHPTARKLHDAPTVYTVEDFLSQIECKALIDIHMSVIEPRSRENMTWCFRNQRLMAKLIRDGDLKVLIRAHQHSAPAPALHSYARLRRRPACSELDPHLLLTRLSQAEAICWRCAYFGCRLPRMTCSSSSQTRSTSAASRPTSRTIRASPRRIHAPLKPQRLLLASLQQAVGSGFGADLASDNRYEHHDPARADGEARVGASELERPHPSRRACHRR